AMLVQLGQRAAREDAVDLLVECHGRIRRFLGFARQLAVAQAPDDEVKAVAGQIRRYFAVAFPLHLADEEELVVPALATAGEPAAAALAEMRADHAAHDPAVVRLVEICGELERAPGALARLAPQLGAVADELSRE